MNQMFLEHVEKALAGEWFGKHIVHSYRAISNQTAGQCYKKGHTMVEVKLNVITPDIRCHGDDRGAIKLADKMAGRNAVQVGHDDIHKNQVVLGAVLDFVHSLESIELRKKKKKVSKPSSRMDIEYHTAVSMTQEKEYRNFPPI